MPTRSYAQFQESGVYHDPLTEFIESVFIAFDFTAAEAKIQLCTKVGTQNAISYNTIE